MMKRILLTLLFLFLSAGAIRADTLSGSYGKIEPLTGNDRILILAPHPDDEAIGCAGIIQQALKAAAQVKIAYLTNGDHNQFAFIVYRKTIPFRKGQFIKLGEVRKTEAIKAMELLGLSKENLVFLGYPDFGTFTIFSRYWQAKKPFSSWLTRISRVPYKEDMSYGAPYKAESILNDLKRVLLDFKPTKIFVSHPVDVNVDHKTFYLFLQVALFDLKGQLPAPQVYPYLIHCVGWPLPRHYHPELELTPPAEFLDTGIKWMRFDLTPEELKEKRRAILSYRSQTESSAFYLLAFARKNELFGDYPEINLTVPRREPYAWVLSWKKIKEKWLPVFAHNQKGLILNGSDIDYFLDEENLLIRIKKARDTARRRVVLKLDLFGYRYNIGFGLMPKIRILTKHNMANVYDAGKLIGSSGVNLELSSTDVLLKIPLKTLGEPDIILAAIRAYTGSLPMHYTGFRRINIIREDKNAGIKSSKN